MHGVDLIGSVNSVSDSSRQIDIALAAVLTTERYHWPADTHPRAQRPSRRVYRRVDYSEQRTSVLWDVSQ